MRIAHDTAAASSLWGQRERLGDLEAYEAPRKTDVLQWDVDTAGALEGTNALLDALGETNPILKDLLKTAKDEINVAAISTYNVAQEEAAAAAAASASSDSSGTTATTTTTTTTTPSYSGRRLMQRKEYNVRMTDALITAEIMTFYGSGGIPGVTSFSCEALCEATAQVDDAHPTARCRAFAFKRASPFSYVDQTGWCYLLQNAGACKIEDFGVELYTRQIESERQCSASAPGLDSAPNAIERHTSNCFTTCLDNFQIHSAWGFLVPGTMRACSRTRTRRQWRHKFRIKTTRRPARAGFLCRAQWLSQCQCSHFRVNKEL